MNQKLNNLTWFNKNIGLQLEDIELELRNKKIILYFDTSDIQTAVMGLQAFYDNGHFKKRRFGKKKTLVNTLIAVGWLGEFNLLPPHLSEFYGKAERNFNLKPTTDWGGEVRKFIKDLTLLSDEHSYDSLHEKSAEELKRIFSKLAVEGIDWFKAIYSMTPWHRKLGVWLRTGLLNLKKENFEYDKIIKSENFEKLKRVFDKHRQAETINNIVDAAALTYLIELVEHFNQGTTDCVPRFFIPRESNTLWQTVLQELNWDEKFICDFDFSPNAPTSVFREEDYFLYKITFRRRDEIKDDYSAVNHFSKEELDEQYEKLTKFRKQAEGAIRLLADIEEPDSQALVEIHINQDLENLINSLQQYSVLNEDWFRNASAEEFLKILHESKESKAIVEEQREIYENKNFKAFVTDRLNDKNKELIEELLDFRLASQLYDALYNSIEGLRRRIKNSPALEADELFAHLGLLRYGFSPSVRELIIEVLNNLRSGESDNIRIGCAETIKWYIEGRKNAIDKATELMSVTGILLAIDNNELLERFFGDINISESSFPVKIALSEFLLKKEPKEERHRQKALKLLGEMELEWRNTESDTKASIALGIAYLYYWIWRWGSSSPSVVWDSQIKGGSLRSDILLNRQIDCAIEYAEYAYQNLPSEQNEEIEKKIYALNLFLFFSIEGSSAEHFRELKERKNELQNYRRTKAWQFRFDDTLARYYVRKAFLSDQTPERKKEFINWAKDYQDKAKSTADGDVEIDLFHDRVRQIWEELD